jgi:hypothetical protein
MTARTEILKFINDKIYLYAFINLIILVIILSSVFTDCTGQVTFTVSQPRLSLSEGNLKITYDILDTRPDDKFNIWLEITDSSGTVLNANTLKGDIGDSINPGENKQIVWNLSADNIFIDNTINIEIIAERIKPEITSEEKDMSEIPSDAGIKDD